MKKKNLIVFGAGGHAVSCIDLILNQGKFKIKFLIEKKVKKKKLFGIKILKEKKNLSNYKKNASHAFIGIGQIKSFLPRKKLFDKLRLEKFKLPTIISKNAYVSPKSEIGIGTVIMHGAIVNAEVKIGDNCIINTAAVIDHGSKIGNNSHISTGVIINGDCTVEDNSFIGSGSILREKSFIKKNSFIKMGSLITKK